MKQYENLVLSPQMNNGKIIDGLGYEITKGMFDKDKKTSYFKTISQKDWLDKQGAEGWKLVAVLRNDMSYDLMDFYFVREIA